MRGRGRPEALLRRRLAFGHGSRSEVAVAVAVALAILAPTIGAQNEARGAITVGPGVVFQPSDSWANLSFDSNQTFSSIRVDRTGVTFDAVRFGIQKLPAALPRAVLNVTTWTPLQAVANATSISFGGAIPAGSTLFYNYSGLLGSRQYLLNVDGVPRGSQFTDANGDVSFRWNVSGSHRFVILFGSRVSPPLFPNIPFLLLLVALLASLILFVVALVVVLVRRRRKTSTAVPATVPNDIRFRTDPPGHP